MDTDIQPQGIRRRVAHFIGHGGDDGQIAVQQSGQLKRCQCSREFAVTAHGGRQVNQAAADVDVDRFANMPVSDRTADGLRQQGFRRVQDAICTENRIQHNFRDSVDDGSERTAAGAGITAAVSDRNHHREGAVAQRCQITRLQGDAECAGTVGRAEEGFPAQRDLNLRARSHAADCTANHLRGQRIRCVQQAIAQYRGEVNDRFHQIQHRIGHCRTDVTRGIRHGDADRRGRATEQAEHGRRNGDQEMPRCIHYAINGLCTDLHRDCRTRRHIRDGTADGLIDQQIGDIQHAVAKHGIEHHFRQIVDGNPHRNSGGRRVACRIFQGNAQTQVAIQQCRQIARLDLNIPGTRRHGSVVGFAAKRHGHLSTINRRRNAADGLRQQRFRGIQQTVATKQRVQRAQHRQRFNHVQIQHGRGHVACGIGEVEVQHLLTVTQRTEQCRRNVQ